MPSLFSREPGSQQLKTFFSQFSLLTFKTGEVIIRPDDEVRFVYFIETGYVSQQVVSENGEDFILNIYRPGSYFPMSLILHGIKNECSYEALTKLAVRKAPVREVLQFMEKNPAVMQELLVRLASGLNSMASKTEALVFGTASRKIAATLYFTAQRFGKLNGKSTVIDFPLTHKRIAAMTGITRETASIEMMKLKKEGILAYKGKEVTIFDMETLYDTCFCQVPAAKS